jgi:hypothetical protein
MSNTVYGSRRSRISSWFVRNGLASGSSLALMFSSFLGGALTGRRAPLVALGKPGEAIGAGRIFTDDATWQADIATLMRRAKGILIVPSDRDGTCFFQPNFTNSPTTCNISHRFASPVAHEAHTFRPEAS